MSETYFLSSVFVSSEDGRQSVLLRNFFSYRLFMANRVVRVENKVLVGVGGLTINTCL